MLKETEKTFGFVVIIFVISGISIGRRTGLFLPPLLVYDCDEVGSNKSRHGKFHSSAAHKPFIGVFFHRNVSFQNIFFRFFKQKIPIE